MIKILYDTQKKTGAKTLLHSAHIAVSPSKMLKVQVNLNEIDAFFTK